MKKLTALAMLALSFIMSTGAFAQISPCYDLQAFCGYDQQCVSDFMPILYVTCSGDASSLPTWQERYEIASPGMLPPPGGGPVNQQPGPVCPPIPPEPGYIEVPSPFHVGPPTMRVYPHLVAHTFWNTPPGCAEYTWEYDVNNPFPLPGRPGPF